MTDKSPTDYQKLAAETLDLWQQHLTALAADSKAKSDLAVWLEPSRQMLDAWMKNAQNAAHGNAPFPFAAPAPGNGSDPAGAARTASAGLASDDGSVRLSELALHVAGLEERVTRLEARRAASARKAKPQSGE